MDCKICGSSTFCTTSGITYCLECNSQVQETQTETNVDFAHSIDRLSSSSTKKTARDKDKRKEYSNWTSVEFFNHIIKMQVSSLIKLGASPKLKTTVLYIWSRYLQKCEIVFRNDHQPSKAMPLLGPVPSKRDKKILYGDKLKSKRKRKRSPSKSITLESDSDDVSDSNSSTSSVASSGKMKYSSHTKKLYRKSALKASNRSTYLNKVFNMTLKKTISFCYLGLLYTEDHLSLIDLIRFIYEDKIPYLNISDKLPPSLKHQDTSGAFITYTVPDAYSIHKTAHEIVQFLKMPKFKEPSVFLAVSRFVKDLNLPDDIKPIIKVLVERYKEQSSKWKNSPTLDHVPHDFQAIVFIVVALKMLFVLDGKFEIEHGRTMNKLDAIYPDNKYFVWKEWKDHTALKEYLFLNNNPGYSATNKLDSLNTDKIITKYQFTHLKSPREGDTDNYCDLVARNKIKDILSSIVSIPDKTDIVPTSFPLINEINCFMNEWRTWPMFKETQEIDFTLLQKDFSSCSLHYNPLQFDKDNDELSYLLMTSLYLPETVVDINCHSTTTFHQVICTTSKYWFFNPVSSGVSAISSDWFEKLSSSFKWLINFISKYTYSNSIFLYREIVQIEKILFVQKRLIYSKSLSELKNKVIVGL